MRAHRSVCLVFVLWSAIDARADTPADEALVLGKQWIAALARHDFDGANAMMSPSTIIYTGTSKDTRKQLEHASTMLPVKRGRAPFDANRDVDWSTYTTEFLDSERTNRYLRGATVRAYRAALDSVLSLRGDVFLIQARVPPCTTYKGCSWNAFLIVIVPGTNGLEVKAFVMMGRFDS
jgi:hypothetical protein